MQEEFVRFQSDAGHDRTHLCSAVATFRFEVNAADLSHSTEQQQQTVNKAFVTTPAGTKRSCKTQITFLVLLHWLPRVARVDDHLYETLNSLSALLICV